MEQIIGGFKEFIVIERGALNQLEYDANQKNFKAASVSMW